MRALELDGRAPIGNVALGLAEKTGRPVAVPRASTVKVVGTCANCRMDVEATVGTGNVPELTGRVFTWFHTASGDELCPERAL
jgi:hypothetical protein